MILKQHALALIALCFGLGLGSCTQITGTVSDHWPHWAGGEPADAPPRPGSPGYQDFIAHRQAASDAATAAATPAQQPIPAAAPSQPAAASPASNDTAVARGGLY
jgi:hypothetical protein